MTSQDRVKLRSDEANNYLKRHRIMELFNNLTAQLIYYRPEKPKSFLIETLEKIQISRSTNSNNPCLFDESNIKSIFGMLDPTGRGFITMKQYEEAMITLGAKEYKQHPLGADEDKINLDTFILEASEGLKNASSTFVD